MAVRLTCVLMWLGRRTAARAICLSFLVGQILRTFSILPTTSSSLLASILDLGLTTTTILPFGACYVIMQKVYSLCANLNRKGLSLRSLDYVSKEAILEMNSLP